MKKILSPVLFIVLILFSSCAEEISSADIPTDQILRKCSATRQSNGKIVARVDFLTEAGLSIPPFRKVHGKNVTLTGSSKVLFNGQEMKQSGDIVGNVYYTLRLDDWPDSFKWEWTDNNGEKYTDEARMQPISLSDNPLKHVGNKFVLEWEGGPIREGEEITATLKQTRESKSSFNDFTTDIGKRSIELNDGGYNLDYSDFEEVKISRRLVISNAKENSVGSQTGSFIEMIYRYEVINSSLF